MRYFFTILPLVYDNLILTEIQVQIKLIQVVILFFKLYIYIYIYIYIYTHTYTQRIYLKNILEIFLGHIDVL